MDIFTLIRSAPDGEPDMLVVIAETATEAHAIAGDLWPAEQWGYADVQQQGVTVIGDRAWAGVIARGRRM